MCLNTLGELDDPKGPLVLGQQALSSWDLWITRGTGPTE